MSADGLKLTLDILPLYISGRGLSYTLPKASWNRIRRGVAEAHGHRCVACGFGGRRESPLQCHEVWEYDLGAARPLTPDEVVARAAEGRTRWSIPGKKDSIRWGVRRLIDLVPLCGSCHLAKHSITSYLVFPYMRRDLAALGRDPEPGDILREALLREGNHFQCCTLARFVEVNHGVSLAVLEAHCAKACALRDYRRDVEWVSDYNGFDRLGEVG